MTDLPRRLCLLLAVSLLAASSPAAAQSTACAAGGDRGFGGTGLAGRSDRGFGGTGATDRDVGGPELEAERDRGFGGTGLGAGDERGFGGTGLSAGVYGTLTGFGSVCVNGLRIEYDADTPLERDGHRIDASRLHRGQTVLVDVGWSSDGLRADRISVEPTLLGPVTDVDPAARRLEVMGETVRVPADALFADGLGLAGITPGDRLSVHGLLDAAGRVVATRLERAAADQLATVVGRAHPAGRGTVAVGATHVQGVRPAIGAVVRVAGIWDARQGALISSTVRPALDFARGTRIVSIETRIESRRGARLETPLVGIDAARASGAVETAVPGVRIWVDGRLNDAGVLEAERIEVEPAGGGLPEPALGLEPDAILRGPGGEGRGRRPRAEQAEDGGHRGRREREGRELEEAEEHGTPELEEAEEHGGHRERREREGRELEKAEEHGAPERNTYDPGDFLEEPRHALGRGRGEGGRGLARGHRGGDRVAGERGDEGEGHHEDDYDSDDSSGPGSGGYDSDDSSGPGSGDYDDYDTGGSSGPGSGDFGGFDPGDSSGPGSGGLGGIDDDVEIELDD